jgi:hypothetical protein
VIPTLNEEEGIVLTLSELPLKELEDMGFLCEVIVIDGESTDKTRENAERFGAQVVIEPRRGYGRAYKTGFGVAKGDILVAFDADFSYPPSIVPMLIGVMAKDDVDFVTADRFSLMENDAMGLLHRFGNWVLNFLVRLLFRVGLRDSQSGMWVIRREVLGRIMPETDGMAFSEEIKIRAFKYCKCAEIPIKYRKRVGKSKITAVLDGIRNLLHLLQLKFIDFRGTLTLMKEVKI